MKIAILTPGGVDRSGTGNVIPCLLALIERLADHGHEVHVFAATQEPKPGRWKLLGAAVHNAGSRLTSARMLLALTKEHRRERFDVIHSLWADYGALASLPRLLLGVPLVVTMPGGELSHLPEIGYGGFGTRAGRLRARLAAAAADVINVPSRYMQALAATRGIEAEVIPLGADPKVYAPIAPRRRNLDAPLRLLHVASLNRVKDQPLLLQAMALLRARGIDFQLDVLGADTLRGEMHALADKLGLDNVHFHGLVPFEQLSDWYRRSDILVVSSRHEAGPVVILEAALAGVPTVGTRVGHMADLSPEASVAIAVGDSDELAAAIEALARDEPRRMQLALAAQRFAEQHDADYTCAAFEEIYRKLADRR